MSVLDSIFPELPTYKGVWHPIYLEPIVGSGERVTVAVVAIAGRDHTLRFNGTF